MCLLFLSFSWQKEKHMVVWVEAAILDDEALLKDKKFQKIKDKLVTFKYVYHIHNLAGKNSLADAFYMCFFSLFL